MNFDIQVTAKMPFKALVALAWRNLWRNSKRTGIMLAAIAVGVWAMIFLTALMRGMVEDMLQRGVNQLPGHVQIHHPAYLDDPSVVNLVPDPEQSELRAVLQGGAVNHWFSRVKVPGMITSERDSRGVILVGIDPLKERETLLTGFALSAGSFLKSSEDSGIVLGQKLVDRLQTGLGKRVVILTQDPDNNLVELGVRIIGVYQAELPSLEERFAYLARNELQKHLGIGSRVSEVAVFGEDIRQVEPLLTQINNGQVDGLSIKAWYEIDGYLGSMLNVMDGFVLVWIIVLFLALSFGLANTLVMAVFERIREIGLILALGMRPTLVLRLIMIESALLLLVGLTIGNLLSQFSVWLTADGIDLSGVALGLEKAGMGTMLYPVLMLKDIMTANLVVLILGMLTSVLPAWRAAQFDPIRALTKPM